MVSVHESCVADKPLVVLVRVQSVLSLLQLLWKLVKTRMIYLEETNKETMQRLIASKLKVNYLEFKNDPESYNTREDSSSL